MQESTKKAVEITNMVQDDIAQEVSVNKSRTSTIIVIVLVALLVVVSALGAFAYMKYRDISSDPKSAISEKNQAETTRVLDGLKRSLLVGETDAPTVARVEDPEKLKSSNPEFYKDIQVGDYLVIFPKRAVIYRESADQIINVAPIINTSDLTKNTPPAEEKK